MKDLPQANMRHVVWDKNVYEPSDDSFALVDAVLDWLQQQCQSEQQAQAQQGAHQTINRGPQLSHLAQQHQQGEQQQQQQGQQQQQRQGQLSAVPGHARTGPQLCLEVGCGSGYVICSVALALQQLYSSVPSTAVGAAEATEAAVAAGQHSEAGASLQQAWRFVATDINPAALEATTATLEAHGVHDVELVQTDLVAGLLPRLQEAVNLLLFNPPYVPTPDEEVERDGIARAWAGGHMGRRVTDRLLAQLPLLLAPSGHAFIVTVPENKPQEIIGLLEQSGLKGEVVLTRAADEECLQIVHVWRPEPRAACAAQLES